jgi:hypothetical protein
MMAQQQQQRQLKRVQKMKMPEHTSYQDGILILPRSEAVSAAVLSGCLRHEYL